MKFFIKKKKRCSLFQLFVENEILLIFFVPIFKIHKKNGKRIVFPFVLI